MINLLLLLALFLFISVLLLFASVRKNKKRMDFISFIVYKRSKELLVASYNLSGRLPIRDNVKIDWSREKNCVSMYDNLMRSNENEIFTYFTDEYKQLNSNYPAGWINALYPQNINRLLFEQSPLFRDLLLIKDSLESFIDDVYYDFIENKLPAADNSKIFIGCDTDKFSELIKPYLASVYRIKTISADDIRRIWYLYFSKVRIGTSFFWLEEDALCYNGKLIINGKREINMPPVQIEDLYNKIIKHA